MDPNDSNGYSTLKTIAWEKFVGGKAKEVWVRKTEDVNVASLLSRVEDPHTTG